MTRKALWAVHSSVWPRVWIFVSRVLISLTSARVAGKRVECRRAALGGGVWEGLAAELETRAEVEAVGCGGGRQIPGRIIILEKAWLDQNKADFLISSRFNR